MEGTGLPEVVRMTGRRIAVIGSGVSEHVGDTQYPRFCATRKS
jgi:hypothetical protein